MIGIYKITNLINGKNYIGQSVDIERRWREHRSSKKTTLISQAIQKYGKDNFSFSVIEECSINDLDKKENYWIKYFNSIEPNGYNSLMGPSKVIHSKDNEIPIQNIINDLKNLSLSINDIAKKYQIDPSTVSRINLGYTHIQENINYPIRSKKPKVLKNKKQKNKGHYCLSCGKKISYSAKLCKQCAGLAKRIPLDQMPVTREQLKELIRTKPFTQIGKQFNVSDNAIRKWCDKFNLPRKSKEIKQYSDKEWEDL